MLKQSGGVPGVLSGPRAFSSANVASQRAPIRKNTCPRIQSLRGFPSGASSGDPALLFAPSGEVVMGVADSGASFFPTLTGLQQSTQLFFWSLAQGQGVPISARSLFLLPFHFRESSANWPNRNSTDHCLQTSALALYLPKGLTGLLTRHLNKNLTLTHSGIHLFIQQKLTKPCQMPGPTCEQGTDVVEFVRRWKEQHLRRKAAEAMAEIMDWQSKTC